MQQLQHPNIMPLLAHSRAMAPMDADQGVTTYYMLFPLFKVTHILNPIPVYIGFPCLPPVCQYAQQLQSLAKDMAVHA